MRCAFEEVAQYRQTSPVGNDFAKSVYSLAVPGTPLGSPQDVAIADYNGDGWDDLATAVFDRNAVAVLVNDRQGGFPQYADRNPLAPAGRPASEPKGYGPIALLGADFNGNGRTDLAVVNTSSSNVTILLDFDSADSRVNSLSRSVPCPIPSPAVTWMATMTRTWWSPTKKATRCRSC